MRIARNPHLASGLSIPQHSPTSFGETLTAVEAADWPRSQRECASALAERLIETETEPSDIERLRLIDGIQHAFG